MSIRRLALYTDGASRGNPGPAAIGVLIADESGRVISRISRRISETTNNRAEYVALIAGLEEAARLGAEHIEVRSDSELLVKQIKGVYRVKNPELKRLYEQVHRLMRRFSSFSIVHISREQNRAADALTRKALHKAQG